jgi:hypothetical protein
MYKCGHCRTARNDLRRCSRCKKVYYCEEAHQLKHWPIHSQTCKENIETPPMSPSDVEPYSSKHHHDDGKVEDDDEIQEVTSSISLACPLMIDKIDVPAKGSKCRHQNCFDLRTFLSLAEQSYNWQCPICVQPLPEPELIVDHWLYSIIKTTPKDVEEIRILENGKIELIHDEAGSDEEGSHDEDEEPPLKKIRVS